MTASALSCGSRRFHRITPTSKRLTVVSTRRLCAIASRVSSTWPYLRVENQDRALPESPVGAASGIRALLAWVVASSGGASAASCATEALLRSDRCWSAPEEWVEVAAAMTSLLCGTAGQD